MLVGDHDLPSTFGMKIIEGRSFDVARATDADRAVLINQEMARQLGWDNAIGQQINMPAIDRELEVVGVLEDFHYRSMHEAIAPIMIFIAPDSWFSMLSVKLRADSIPTTLEGLKAVYERFDVNNPFTFTFVDQEFDNLYVADRQVVQLLRISTILAILVACLGLFGLAAFTAERRTKEIGVRKVVGASIGRIVILLTRETAILVGIALVIATPLVLFFARDWLDSFAYSGGIKYLTLVVGACLAFVLAVLTTGLQAWRASRMDPVKALRTE
jgi:putative ABC transport system permease protein